MQKYFISNEEFNNLIITSDDVNHIKNVMRFKPHDFIIVSNGDIEYVCEIINIEKNSVSFKKTEQLINNNELPFVIDLYQGYPSRDKLDDIIKHTTEMGVSNIYPTITRRSIMKIDQDKKDSKLIRFNKIAKEASEQSNRKHLTKVVDIVNLKKLEFNDYDFKIVCYEELAHEGLSNLKRTIKSFKPDAKVAIVIGPEGGLDKEEVISLTNMGFVACGLGPRILRTETASNYILSAISYEWELK